MTGPEKMREIIGVVGNVKHLSLRNEDSPEMYLPQTQIPFNIMSLVVRTSVSNPARSNECDSQRTGRAMDPTIPLTSVRVFDEYISRSLARPRFNALLLSIFAGNGAVLTAIGIYGVMAYSVAQRTNEIGIRIALGAAQSIIFRLVVGQAMTLVGISVVLGLAGAFAATRLLNSLLFGVGASDPITFGAHRPSRLGRRISRRLAAGATRDARQSNRRLARRMNDLRFAFRTLLKTPSFSLTSLLALGLGIGADHGDVRRHLRISAPALAVRETRSARHVAIAQHPFRQ